MSKMKFMKITKIKFFVTIFILAMIIFGIYNIIWFNYVKRFDVFLYTEKLQEIKLKPTSGPNRIHEGVEIPHGFERYTFFESEGWKVHGFRDYDYDEVGYYYGITIPPYLKFSGNIQIALRKDEYMLSLLISPQKWLYILQIGEIVDNMTYLDSSAVDKNGQPLGKHPNDSEEFYQRWLMKYEKYYEQVMELFATVNDMYGDILK